MKTRMSNIAHASPYSLNRMLAGMALATVCATCSMAKEYFVFAGNYGLSGLDGLTEETAFGTIQDAVNAAETNGESGDIITVLPGIYDKGGKTYLQTVEGTTIEATNRVSISESGLLLRSRDGAATTVIKGAVDEAGVATNEGIGPAAVGCVIVLGTGANVTIEGFTLLDGHTQTAVAEGAIQSGSGGAVNSRRTARDVYVVDCIVRDCAGGRGGAFLNATVVRAEITGCISKGGGASVGRTCNFVHCLIRDNPGSGGLFFSCDLFGCTVVENYLTNVFSTGNNVANSVFLHNAADYGPTGGNGFARNSAFANIRGGASGDVNFSEVTECIAECAERQFFAPLLGDYRPLPDAQITGLGQATHLTFLSGHESNVDLYRSLDGVSFAHGAVVPAGCFHQLAPTPGGGCIQFNKPVSVEGREPSKVSELYAFFEYPGQLLNATAVASDGKGIVGYNCSFGIRFPEMDDSFWMMTPPAGVVVTNNPIIAPAANVFYVNPDPAIGVDIVATGRGRSAETPFLTLQYAVDKSPQTAGSYVLIIAAEGIYNQGGKVYASHTNRVSISGNGVCRIKGPGREKATILGRRDPASPSGDGRGPDSSRCAAISSMACLQGFTLKDGCCSWEGPNGTATTSSQLGGAVFLEHALAQIADSTITGGCAYRGGACYGEGEIIRTIITNNAALAGGMIRKTALDSCLLADNWGGNYNTDGPMTHCTTYAGANDGNAWVRNSATATLRNNIIHGKGSDSFDYPPEQFSGNLFWSVGTVPEGETKADPCFVSPQSGDYRVFTHSPALAVSKRLELYWESCLTDLHGNPRRYHEGRAIAGAMDGTPRQMVVADPPDGISLDDGMAGSYVVEAGTALTVTYSGIGSDGRSLLAYNEAGELVATNIASYVCSLAPDYSDSVSRILRTPIYQTELFANPVLGNDEHSGWREDAPKRTLAAAMAVASSGDTVHAAPGTYDQGTMLPAWNAAATIASRVHVKDGVTLVADEGPERTFIVGQDAPTGNAGGGGILGPGAVRGATVASTGCLRGFTVTGGRTLYNGNTIDYFGGGVLGASLVAKVVDCVISNNCASRGGGGSEGSFVNCRIIGNYARLTSCGLYRAYADGCLFAKNLEGGSQLFRFAYRVNGCTFADDNMRNATAPITSFFPEFYFTRVENTIFLGKTSDSFTATNCIFVTGEATGVIAGDNRWVGSKDEVGVGPDFVPVKGGAAIDNGIDKLIAANIVREGKDAAGNQRIYNGRGDIGAFEYDWRGDYKADLGNSGFVVEEAAPEVVETTDGHRNVLVRSGQLRITLPALGPGFAQRTCALNAQVTGQGKLDILVNGVVFATLESGAAQMIKFKAASDESTQLACVYTRHADDDDSVGALLTSFDSMLPGSCLFLK